MQGLLACEVHKLKHAQLCFEGCKYVVEVNNNKRQPQSNVVIGKHVGLAPPSHLSKIMTSYSKIYTVTYSNAYKNSVNISERVAWL